MQFASSAVRLLETARKDGLRCCEMRWRLHRQHRPPRAHHSARGDATLPPPPAANITICILSPPSLLSSGPGGPHAPSYVMAQWHTWSLFRPPPFFPIFHSPPSDLALSDCVCEGRKGRKIGDKKKEQSLRDLRDVCGNQSFFQLSSYVLRRQRVLKVLWIGVEVGKQGIVWCYP